jgi:hypothetical protein
MLPPVARDYFFIAGFEAPAAMPACPRWNLVRPGGPGLAASAAFFMRSARSSGDSGASFGRSLIGGT